MHQLMRCAHILDGSIQENIFYCTIKPISIFSLHAWIAYPFKPVYTLLDRQALDEGRLSADALECLG